jgi:hypothetical protein
MIDHSSLNVRRYLKARSARVALQKALQEYQSAETAAYGLLKRDQLALAQQLVQDNPYETVVRLRVTDARTVKGDVVRSELGR